MYSIQNSFRPTLSDAKLDVNRLDIIVFIRPVAETFVDKDQSKT